MSWKSDERIVKMLTEDDRKVLEFQFATESIITIEDVLSLTESDMREMKLGIGLRNRLKHAIEAMKEQPVIPPPKRQSRQKQRPDVAEPAPRVTSK